MDIYLIRHAEAAPADEHTLDADRALTATGKAQSKQLAQMFSSRNIALDAIFASPLVRAWQTAEIMTQHWDRSDLNLEVCDELVPKVKARKLSRFLIKQSGEHVGLVGHMPDLAHFAGWLIGDKNANIILAKAGVAYLEGELPGKGVFNLRWLVTPDWYK